MLYLLTVSLQLVDKMLEAPAARKRLEKKGKALGLKTGEQLVLIPELGIALPEREAKHLHPELIRRLAIGKGLHEDLRQAGVLQ